MANTNTNTNDHNLLSTDIYDVSAFLDQIRQDQIPDHIIQIKVNQAIIHLC